jgi:phosphonate transport system permease protein
MMGLPTLGASRRRPYGRLGFNWANPLLILVGLVVLGWSVNGTSFSLTVPFEENNLKSVGRFVSGLFPPDLSPDFLRSIARLAVETIQISVLGTALAIALGFPLGVLAMRQRGEEVSRGSLGSGRWLLGWSRYYVARMTLNVLRAVPELVWALVFVVAVGLGPFPGVLALAAHSTGVLGKLYSELFESVDQRLVEAGRSTGASELGVLLFVRVPSMLPALLSYTLFRWECNMRSATLLGFVGAGGIGSQLTISMKLFQYHEVLTLAMAILLLVVLTDVVGQIIRTRVLDARSIACGPALAEG